MPKKIENNQKTRFQKRIESLNNIVLRTEEYIVTEETNAYIIWYAINCIPARAYGFVGDISKDEAFQSCKLHIQ